ncbi:MAG: NYN domain-containing protein, partial [Pseudomonadota bacterium]
VDAMELADKLDHVVLFSGDGDFKSLVAALQKKGVRVSVVSTLATQPPMVADDLRRQADQFFDLSRMEAKIARAGGMARPVQAGSRDRERPPAPARFGDGDYHDEYYNED